MAPQIEPLAQSVSKAKFFRRLGLSTQQENDNRVYRLMKEEAVRGRERILGNPRSLLPQLRNDPTIRPPYSNVQISETAMHQEILNIYRGASSETRPWYEKSHDTDSTSEENWIIRWMLWHVFRFRDNRNKNKPLRGSKEQTLRKPSSSPPSDGAEPRRVVSGQGYWDPVRDAQRTAGDWHLYTVGVSDACLRTSGMEVDTDCESTLSII